MASQSTIPSEHDEDTIELELSAEEMLGLSRAFSAAQTARTDPEPVSLAAATPPAHCAGKRRIRPWPMVLVAALVAALVGIATTIAWRPGPSHRVVRRIAPAPVVNSAPPVASQPAPVPQPQEPQGPPRRVRNPFDAHEVFEFPAGTAKAEARQKVAELLMQRAADRGAPGKGVEPTDPRRAQE